jgi:hypothetical protein
MQLQTPEHVITCPLTSATQRSARPVSASVHSVRHCPVGPVCGLTITGTGLKKWSPDSLSFECESNRRAYNLPITRPALRLPTADAADSPCGTAEAAILVIEMEDVLVAKIVSGFVSAANSTNMRCLISRFSETALSVHSTDWKGRVDLPAHLDDHIDVSQPSQPHIMINDRYSFTCMSRVGFLNLSFRDILGQ